MISKRHIPNSYFRAISINCLNAEVNKNIPLVQIDVLPFLPKNENKTSTDEREYKSARAT